jgi:hypothetical protein
MEFYNPFPPLKFDVEGERDCPEHRSVWNQDQSALLFSLILFPLPVTQMAIFEHFKQFPKLSTERTSNILGGNRHEADKVALREFCGLVTSPRHFNTEWDLHKVINRMIPFPHKLSFLSFPIISEFVGVCPQEYFAVSERQFFFSIFIKFLINFD